MLAELLVENGVCTRMGLEQGLGRHDDDEARRSARRRAGDVLVLDEPRRGFHVVMAVIRPLTNRTPHTWADDPCAGPIPSISEGKMMHGPARTDRLAVHSRNYRRKK